MLLLEEGEVVAAGSRPPHAVVVLDDMHGVLDVLPVKVNVRAEVDLAGEECAHCWLDVAGGGANAGFVCLYAAPPRCHSHHIIGWACCVVCGSPTSLHQG
jgi:hypothetical protein